MDDYVPPLDRLTDTTQTLLVEEMKLENEEDDVIVEEEIIIEDSELGKKEKKVLRYTKRGDHPII